MAEVDYIYPFESELVPIEVKSSAEGSLRSLHQFMDEVTHDKAIRFYSGDLRISKVNTPKGKKFQLLNLPYCLASQTEKYVAWFMNQ